MAGGCWLAARPKFECSGCTSIFSPISPPHWGLSLPWSWDLRLDRSEKWVESMYSEACSELVWSMGLPRTYTKVMMTAVQLHSSAIVPHPYNSFGAGGAARE